MTMSPVPINYADQVLREEADRLANLKENAAAKFTAEAKKATEGREESRVKVNLKDEDNFPTLGKAKGKAYIVLTITVH